MFLLEQKQKSLIPLPLDPQGKLGCTVNGSAQYISNSESGSSLNKQPNGAQRVDKVLTSNVVATLVLLVRLEFHWSWYPAMNPVFMNAFEIISHSNLLATMFNPFDSHVPDRITSYGIESSAILWKC